MTALSATTPATAAGAALQRDGCVSRAERRDECGTVNEGARRQDAWLDSRNPVFYSSSASTGLGQPPPTPTLSNRQLFRTPSAYIRSLPG
uniref:Uncharacterized protein n=1 Tax=Plectus sambesii TaxID=2011161 RepID=A0A914V648_9BILA